MSLAEYSRRTFYFTTGPRVARDRLMRRKCAKSRKLLRNFRLWIPADSGGVGVEPEGSAEDLSEEGLAGEEEAKG